MYDVDKEKIFHLHNLGVPLKKIIKIHLEYGINMRSINLDAHDGIFEGNLYLYIQNTDLLETLITKLLNIKGVDTVSRKEI